MAPQNIMVKSEIHFFIERKTLCDSADTDQAFDFHAVNG